MSVVSAAATLQPLEQASIRTIALRIVRDWKSPYYGAKPYLEAMAYLETVDDNYGCDSGRDIVLRFLCNAQTYRGDNARAIKAELKRRCGKASGNARNR